MSFGLERLKEMSVLFGWLILVKIAARSGCDARRGSRLTPACAVWRCLLGYMRPRCFGIYFTCPTDMFISCLTD